MPIDTSIITNFLRSMPQHQPLDPLEQQAKQQRLQAGTQALQSSALQLQEQQRQISEGDQLRQLFAQNLSPEETRRRAYAINPQTALAWDKGQLALQKEKEDLDKARDENTQRHLGVFASSAGAVRDEAGANQFLTESVAKGHVKPEDAAQILTLPIDERLDTIHHLGDRALTHQEQIANERAAATEARAKAEEARKAAAAPSELEKTKAQAAGAVLTTAQQQKQADAAALASALETGAGEYWKVRNAMPPERFSPFAGAYIPAQILKIGTTPEQRIQAGQAAATAAETKKQHEIQNKFEETRIGIENTRNARENNIYNQTYGPDADQALVGVEKGARLAARKEFAKAGDQYIQASRATDEMQNFIDLAKSGNKAAYANMPVAGVLEITTANGVKRINRNELEAFGNAGSLFDKVAGKLGKWTAGQPIPSDVLKDIEQLHQTIRAGARKTYEKSVENTNLSYHSNFKPGLDEQKPGGGTPTINTKAEYDKLSSGARYIDAEDGKIYTKR